MYNIGNTNNIGNMGHLTKEQFTWQFWNMAGITMYLQLPFNSSSHLFYLHDLCESQTYMASCVDWGFKGGGIGFYTWCLLLIFWAGRKCLVRKLCSKEQLPSWSYPVVIVRSKEANLSHICVNKNMWLLICWVEFIKRWRWWHCLKTKIKRKSEDEEERKKQYWLR